MSLVSVHRRRSVARTRGVGLQAERRGETLVGVGSRAIAAGATVCLLLSATGCRFGYELLDDQALGRSTGGEARPGNPGRSDAGAGSPEADAGDAAGTGSATPLDASRLDAGRVDVSRPDARSEGAEAGDVASCADGATNQDESDVDCGGVCGSTCSIGQACSLNLDCATDNCLAAVCSASHFASLAHRYRFDGAGTVLTDSAGGADGNLVNASLSGSGSVSLSGGQSNQHGNLPNGIVSALTNATFEVWFTWDGLEDWERVFDLGNSNAPEGTQGDGRTYLFLTPRNTFAGGIRAAFTTSGGSGETEVDDPNPATPGALTHVAVVMDDANDSMSLYVDGIVQDTSGWLGQLSGLVDENNWLGKSQWSVDVEFGGDLHEFRVYAAALSASQIAASHAAGPDAD